LADGVKLGLAAIPGCDDVVARASVSFRVKRGTFLLHFLCDTSHSSRSWYLIFHSPKGQPDMVHSVFVLGVHNFPTVSLEVFNLVSFLLLYLVLTYACSSYY
jgi:hypothetical protein